MFLHVLGQVGLLRVGFPTVRTDVSLQVFGLLVLRDVVEEGGLVVETFVAGVALVGLVSLMTPRMGLQVGQLGEGLGAAWKMFNQSVRKLSSQRELTSVATLIGLVSSVGSDVLLEVGQLGELPLTDLAPVGLDAQVDPHVLGEVGAVGE